MNYQKTLNLPKTEFSMRAELAQKEPQWLALWETNQLHAAIREARAGCEPYVLHDGPPYANGNIHIGHALNKILKDIIVKMKTMQGYDALYVPGWDCHGLPIEHQLFKELKKRKSDVDTVDFRRKAHDYAMKYVDIQREQFQRLGVLGQWEKPYLTLSPEYEYWILSSFSSLVKDGYVYRGLKPVNWCPNCETALAEAEVEYEDHNSPSVYVKFQVNNPQALGRTPKGKPLSLMIWTTTPWTLLANVAVAVHRAFQYVCVDIGEEAVVLEKTLCERVLGKAGVAKYEVLQEVSGEALQELLYTHPFGLKQNCRVVVVDYVTKEDGTGLVHTAPGHGQEDYEAGLEHHLDILMPVDDQGLFTQEAGAFAGQHVFKANEQIIQNLKARGMLAASETISHSYPHCWRCKKPIIFRATHQWFMKIDHKDLRAKLRQAVQEKILWIPASGQERMTGMIISRPDWCLSRQRHWGVPIPALECEGCGGEHKLYPAVIDHFASIVRTEGTDAWFRKGLPELLPEGFACPDCGKRAFKRTFDILDVWFDSGVSHKAVVGPMLGRKIPVDLYLEGSDQHRGWFQSSLIPAVALDGMPPYKAVLTHGFVMDGQGRKMSKSLGNVISPQDVIKTNGADILRLWVASSNYHDDIRLSKEIMARVIDAYRKIRNTIRFLLGNLDGFDPLKELLGYDHLVEIDQWALHKLQQVALDLREAYEQFEFARAYKLIYSYCNEALSGFYLDILKDRLYTSHAFSRERKSAQTVLFHILNHLVCYIAPVLSFTAEEVFQLMPKTPQTACLSSVHLLQWPDCLKGWRNERLEKKFCFLETLRPHVLKALEDSRREEVIGSSLEARIIFRTSSDRDAENLNTLAAILPQVFIVSQVEVERVEHVSQGVHEEFPKTAIIIQKAYGNKCVRCWNYSPVPNQSREHPELCERCLPVVEAMIRDGLVDVA